MRLPIEPPIPSEVNPYRNNDFRMTGAYCAYCNIELCVPIGASAGKHRPSNLLTVDHKIPKTRGGEDKAPNLAMACLKCNIAKGNRTPEEFRVKRHRTRKSANYTESAA